MKIPQVVLAGLCSFVLSVANANEAQPTVDLNSASSRHPQKNVLLDIERKDVISTEVAQSKPTGEDIELLSEKGDDGFKWQITTSFLIGRSASPIIGVEANEYANGLGLLISADLFYKGFYLQTNKRRSAFEAPGELGYQIIDDDEWGLDVLLTSYFWGFSPREIIEEYGDIPELEGLEDRYGGGAYAIRYSKYIDEDILYLDLGLVNAGGGTKDLVVNAFYSHLVPYRNWDIYFGAGFTYFEASAIDYFVGIDEHEVNEHRSIYRAGGGFFTEFEIYAQYPLSESWLLNLGINHEYYSDAISDSPLFNRKSVITSSVGVRYVF